jgi:hypothetical protein
MFKHNLKHSLLSTDNIATYVVLFNECKSLASYPCMWAQDYTDTAILASDDTVRHFSWLKVVAHVC